MKKIVLLLILILMNSCGKVFVKEEIVSKYDKTDFSIFKNISIFDRYGVYMINKENLPYYAVDYNHLTNNIIRIRKANNFKDYLTKDEIDKIITEFNKYEFNGIDVDDNLNVHFFIMAGNCTHFFLRKNAISNLKSLQKNYYQKINEKWFYNKECAATR